MRISYADLSWQLWTTFLDVGVSFCINICCNGTSSILRKICKILPIAMGLYVSVCRVCVCLCVCVCVTFIGTSRHLPSNDVIAKIELLDLDLHFRFQMFKICEIRLFPCYQKLKL